MFSKFHIFFIGIRAHLGSTEAHLGWAKADLGSTKASLGSTKAHMEFAGILMKKAMECRGQYVTSFTPDALVGFFGVDFPRRFFFFKWTKNPESSFDASDSPGFQDCLKFQDSGLETCISGFEACTAGLHQFKFGLQQVTSGLRQLT